MTSCVHNKRVFVFGLGKSGLSAIAYLKKHGAHILAWDDSSEKCAAIPKDLLSDLDNTPWDTIDFILLSPGVPHEGPKAHPIAAIAKAHSIPLQTDVEIFLRDQENSDHTIIGITGTNGKSTTTALLCHFLREFGAHAIAAGNIGTPVLDLPEETQPTFYVLELSSYQLSLMETKRLDYAVILNISPDHLAYHGSMQAYTEAKQHIFDLMAYQGFLFTDDAYTRTMTISHPYVERIRSTDLPALHHPKLMGAHNHQNFVAASILLEALLPNKVSTEVIVKALHSFTPLPHRQELVTMHNNILFVNDSKATNMDAVYASLSSFQNIHWILGGQPKEGDDPTSLKDYFSRVTHAYPMGAAKASFRESLQDHLPCTPCDTIEEALKAAYANAQKHPGESVILLAPGCASFDQFSNFEERGQCFKDAVQRLVGVS